MIGKKTEKKAILSAVITVVVAILLGFLKNRYYANEYSTIHAPLPAVQLETLTLDLNKQGIFKKVGQPRKLYLRVRNLHNTSDKAMKLQFVFMGDEKMAQANIKINSKPFDIQKDTLDLAAGEEARLNFYINLTKEGYQKGNWSGKLLIQDAKKSNEMIGQIPIEIVNEGRRS